MRTFGPATPSDIPEISKLVNSAYRGETSRAGWTTEADFLDGQRTDIEALRDHLQDGTILQLREDGELIGCVYLEEAEAGVYYLGMLTVKPHLQAAGLGREILQKGEAYAKAKGARRIHLQVLHVRDTLISWYERRGYKPNGKTEPFHYGDARFGLPLRPDLYFIQFEKPL